MAHYAYINALNKVVEVITGPDDGHNGKSWEEWETFYSERKGITCKRTCKKTSLGEHKDGGTPFRKNYAGIGYSYDEARDAFIPPKEFNSWVLNEDSCQWEAPIPYPNDGKNYLWDEAQQQWIQIPTE